MIDMDFRTFYGKLLLFGEYIVIQGGRSLALPIKNFKGVLSSSDDSIEGNLDKFINHVKNQSQLNWTSDASGLQNLMHLKFNSNIPVGYGAGSSGALTAAIYDAFIEKNHQDLHQLKEILALIENYFHGQSSGLDPLVIYLEQPTLVSKDEILPLDFSPELKHSLEHFLLIDTGASRSTGPLVEIFKRKLLDQSYNEACLQPLIAANEQAISSTLDYELQGIRKSMNTISDIQFQFFKEMIPRSYLDIWEELLESENMSLKLCGAGGGGFLLFFSEDPQEGINFLDQKEVDFLDIEI